MRRKAGGRELVYGERLHPVHMRAVRAWPRSRYEDAALHEMLGLLTDKGLEEWHEPIFSQICNSSAQRPSKYTNTFKVSKVRAAWWRAGTLLRCARRFMMLVVPIPANAAVRWPAV